MMTLAQSEPKIVYRIAPDTQALFFRRRHQASRPPPVRTPEKNPCPASVRHDAPCPLRRDKIRPLTASPGGRALDDPLQLSKNIRCFSNMRRLPSSASSSDSAISERWPVFSASLTIARWRAIWTANSAICRLACARYAKRNQACARPSRVARASSSCFIAAYARPRRVKFLRYTL